jgi:hypothetical protein
MVQAIVSDRKQGPPIAQGRGSCEKCGAGLHVLGEEFSRSSPTSAEIQPPQAWPRVWSSAEATS